MLPKREQKFLDLFALLCFVYLRARARACVCVCVCVRAHARARARARVCVCVCERERERERDSLYNSVCPVLVFNPYESHNYGSM